MFSSIKTNLGNHFKAFLTNGSTWVVVLSVLLTAFTAVPYGYSIWIHLLNPFILAFALIWAHHEGRAAERMLRR